MFANQIPETPIWLLSKKRDDDALKALQWLRGWVPIEAVAEEYHALKRYNSQSNACDACKLHQRMCAHPSPTMCEKIRSISDRESRHPLYLLLLLYAILYSTSIASMRPYIVQIFDSYGTNGMNGATAASYLSLLAIFANAFIMMSVRWIGKRPIYLISLGVGALSCLLLGK